MGNFVRGSGPHLWKVYYVKNKVLDIKKSVNLYHPAAVVAENQKGEMVLIAITHDRKAENGNTELLRQTNCVNSYFVKKLIIEYKGKPITSKALKSKVRNLNLTEKEINTILRAINKLQ